MGRGRWHTGVKEGGQRLNGHATHGRPVGCPQHGDGTPLTCLCVRVLVLEDLGGSVPGARGVLSPASNVSCGCLTSDSPQAAPLRIRRNPALQVLQKLCHTRLPATLTCFRTQDRQLGTALLAVHWVLVCSRLRCATPGS
jgi:hypothetical protein